MFSLPLNIILIRAVQPHFETPCPRQLTLFLSCTLPETTIDMPLDKSLLLKKFC
jgi:hypothetical protein